MGGKPRVRIARAKECPGCLTMQCFWPCPKCMAVYLVDGYVRDSGEEPPAAYHGASAEAALVVAIHRALACAHMAEIARINAKAGERG